MGYWFGFSKADAQTGLSYKKYIGVHAGEARRLSDAREGEEDGRKGGWWECPQGVLQPVTHQGGSSSQAWGSLLSFHGCRWGPRGAPSQPPDLVWVWAWAQQEPGGLQWQPPWAEASLAPTACSRGARSWVSIGCPFPPPGTRLSHCRAQLGRLVATPSDAHWKGEPSLR